MAVAVKNSTETAKPRPMNSLAVGSLAGAVYILASLAVLFYGLPNLWSLFVSPLLTGAADAQTAVDRALLVVAMVGAATGLFLLGYKLAGPVQPRGARAGIVVCIVGLLLTLLLVRLVGGVLESSGKIEQPAGLAIIGVLAAVCVGGLGYLFFVPRFGKVLIALDEQGWFSAQAYKRSQGVRVRRGTILGFLILAGCGVYTLLSHNVLGTSGITHLQVRVPFTDTLVPLLPDVAFTIPILLIAGGLWIGWRLVNFPPFADFLIATEAEMNKVSWTTRKRLIQDTIVVLTTMLLLTVFLFTVDIVWSRVLSNPWMPIVQPPNTKENQPVDANW